MVFEVNFTNRLFEHTNNTSVFLQKHINIKWLKFKLEYFFNNLR